MHYLAPITRRTSYQAILLAALASSLLHTASAAQQIYFQLEGSDIASDHLSKNWEGWIAGRAFGQSYTRSSLGTRIPTLVDQDFHIVKGVDKATPLLSRAMLEGRVFPKLTVVYLTAEDPNEPPVQVEFQNVSISSHRLSGDVDRLTEDVAFDPLEARVLISLLPRFIEPHSGRVLIDEEDIVPEWLTTLVDNRNRGPVRDEIRSMVRQAESGRRLARGGQSCDVA